jgi:hypothetical protein
VTQTALESLLPSSVAERARRIQSESGGRLDLIAAKLGLISDAELAGLYATHLGEPVLPASHYPASAVAADRLRPNYFRRARLLPVEEHVPTRVVTPALMREITALELGTPSHYTETRCRPLMTHT